MEYTEDQYTETTSKKKPWVLIFVLITMVASGVYAMSQQKTSSSTDPLPSQAAMERLPSPQGESMSPDNLAIEETKIREISIKGTNMSFDPKTITVKKGSTVRLTLTNADASDEWEITHDFVIDELGVASTEIGEGESTTIEFTADKVGEFEYYCSIGKHREMGMVGTLVVTE